MRKIISLLNCSWFANQLIIETKNKIHLTLLRIKTLGNINSFQSNCLFIKELNLKTMLLFIGVLLVSLDGNSQIPKIRFEYDAAGNQIQRKWCPNCLSRNAQETYKDVSQIEDSDLEKFFPEDVISYYPNPVKEELFLKWELVNENKVSSIDVFTLNGQVLKTIKENLSQNSLIISFQEYPVGVYYLSLNYTNGNQKSIKIIKN
jgi:hypothetical protein